MLLLKVSRSLHQHDFNKFNQYLHNRYLLLLIIPNLVFAMANHGGNLVANDTYNWNTLQVEHVHLERRRLDAVGQIYSPKSRLLETLCIRTTCLMLKDKHVVQ